MKEHRKTKADETIQAHVKRLKRPVRESAPPPDIKGNVRKILTEGKCQVPENW